MHGDKVLKLIEVELECVGESFTTLVDHFMRHGQILVVNEAPVHQVLNVVHGGWVLVSPADLVDIGGLHQDEGKLFKTNHLQIEKLVHLPDHGIKRHFDRQKQANCVELAKLKAVVGENRLISEVTLSDKNGEVLAEAFAATMLAGSVPHGVDEKLTHH